MRIVALYTYLVSTGRFEEIMHVFPITGHTMLPCDRDFGDIERCLRKKVSIYTPSEYVKVIAAARRVNPFTVHEMTASDFINLDDVVKRVSLKKSTNDGHKVDFRGIMQLKVCKECPMMLNIKSTHNEGEAWQVVSLLKRSRQVKNVADVSLPVKYTSARALPKNKVGP